jgi:hypothetical protein
MDDKIALTKHDIFNLQCAIALGLRKVCDGEVPDYKIAHISSASKRHHIKITIERVED